MVLEQLDIQIRKTAHPPPPCLTPHTTKKCITDPNVKATTIKLLEVNTKDLCNIGISQDSLDKTQKAKIMKEKFDKLDFMKIFNVCSLQKAIKKMKKQVRMGENVCHMYI